MDVRTLSSGMTFVAKFIFPIVWGAGFGTLMLWGMSGPDEKWELQGAAK